MKSYKYGNGIYPEDLTDAANIIKDKFGITIKHLLCDGNIEFTYDENLYEIRKYPGDFSFWCGEERSLTVVENITTIDFYGPGLAFQEEEILTQIPIMI